LFCVICGAEHGCNGISGKHALVELQKVVRQVEIGDCIRAELGVKLRWPTVRSQQGQLPAVRLRA
jgi:hypothetical protein